MQSVGKNKAYTYLTERDALQWSAGRRGQAVEEIVLHHWGARGQSFEQVMAWFCDNPLCETSAHYVAEGGRVACIVSPHDTAYHTGVWQRNLCSIGIECRPEADSEDYATVAQLVADIWQEWGELPIVPHRAIVATNCPGVWDVACVEQMAQAIYAQRLAPKVIEQHPDKWAETAWQAASKQGILDGTRPRAALTRQELAIVLERVDIV